MQFNTGSASLHNQKNVIRGQTCSCWKRTGYFWVCRFFFSIFKRNCASFFFFFIFRISESTKKQCHTQIDTDLHTHMCMNRRVRGHCKALLATVKVLEKYCISAVCLLFAHTHMYLFVSRDAGDGRDASCFSQHRNSTIIITHSHSLSLSWPPPSPHPWYRARLPLPSVLRERVGTSIDSHFQRIVYILPSTCRQPCEPVTHCGYLALKKTKTFPQANYVWTSEEFVTP